MAKTSILTVMIQLARAGNGDRETIKGLAQIKQNVGLAMGAFAALAGVGATLNKTYQQTTQVFLDYATQVRDMQRITGMTAQETSRLIQAADDLGISYESLSKAMWAANKQGVETSIDSLAAMADQYNSLGSASEQAEFLTKQFGKSGAEMGKLMEKGGAGVRAYTDAIQGSLVLTDEAVAAAREHEMAMDELTDTWQAVKVAAGQDTVGPLTKGLKSLNEQLKEEGILGIGTADVLQILWASFKKGEETTNSAAQSYTAWAEAVAESTPNVDAAAEAAAKLAEQQQQIMDVAFQLQDANDSYNDKLDEYYEKQRTATTEVLAAREAYAQHKLSLDDLNQAEAQYNTTIDETGAGIMQLADQHEMAMNRIVFSILQSQAAADGLSAEESKALLGIAVNLKLLDKNTAELATQMVQSFGEITQGVQESGSFVERFNEEIWVAGTQVGTYEYKFIIRTVGNVPNFAGMGAEETVTTTGRGGHLVGNYAEGGQLGMGWAMVGDAPGGRITPYTELVSPTGYVYDHETSMQLLNSGMVPQYSMAFGGDFDLQSHGSTTTKRKSGISGSSVLVQGVPFSGSTVSGEANAQSTTEISNQVENALASTTSATTSMASAFDRSTQQQERTLAEITTSNQNLLAAVGQLGDKIEKLQDVTVRATAENLQKVLA